MRDVIINDGLGNEVSVVHRLLKELVNSCVLSDQQVISQSPASRRQSVNLTLQVLSYPPLTQIARFLVNLNTHNRSKLPRLNQRIDGHRLLVLQNRSPLSLQPSDLCWLRGSENLRLNLDNSLHTLRVLLNLSQLAWNTSDNRCQWYASGYHVKDVGQAVHCWNHYRLHNNQLLGVCYHTSKGILTGYHVLEGFRADQGFQSSLNTSSGLRTESADTVPDISYTSLSVPDDVIQQLLTDHHSSMSILGVPDSVLVQYCQSIFDHWIFSLHVQQIYVLTFLGVVLVCPLQLIHDYSVDVLSSAFFDLTPSPTTKVCSKVIARILLSDNCWINGTNQIHYISLVIENRHQTERLSILDTVFDDRLHYISVKASRNQVLSQRIIIDGQTVCGPHYVLDDALCKGTVLIQRIDVITSTDILVVVGSDLVITHTHIPTVDVPLSHVITDDLDGTRGAGRYEAFDTYRLTICTRLGHLILTDTILNSHDVPDCLWLISQHLSEGFLVRSFKGQQRNILINGISQPCIYLVQGYSTIMAELTSDVGSVQQQQGTSLTSIHVVGQLSCFLQIERGISLFVDDALQLLDSACNLRITAQSINGSIKT